jgi:hypothetical protein
MLAARATAMATGLEGKLCALTIIAKPLQFTITTRPAIHHGLQCITLFAAEAMAILRQE